MIETVAGLTDLQIRLFAALGQLAVACGVAIIALRQWRTAHDQAITARKKLKADLFDKRMAALSEIEDPLIEILKGNVNHALSIRIQRGGRRFKYLFDARASAVANEIGQAAAELAIIAERMMREPFDVEGRQALAQRSHHLSKYLGEQLLALHDCCTAELTLEG